MRLDKITGSETPLQLELGKILGLLVCDCQADEQSHGTACGRTLTPTEKIGDVKTTHAPCHAL